MVNQMMNASKLEQLPPAARDRIEKLRLLFIDRSRGHLVQIRELLEKRQTAGEQEAVDADLVQLAHSLAGTSGIFGFQSLGEAAVKVEATLRETGHSEADFAQAIDELIDQLNELG